MRIEAFLEQSPVFCVTLTARRFDVLIARLLKADGLNFLEALLLATLYFESPAPVKPSALAATFGTTRGNISHCVSSLEARGLIQRRIHPEDARSYELTLKPQGKKVAVRVIGALHKLQSAFEEKIGKEKLKSTLSIIHELANSSL